MRGRGPPHLSLLCGPRDSLSLCSAHLPSPGFVSPDGPVYLFQALLFSLFYSPTAFRFVRALVFLCRERVGVLTTPLASLRNPLFGTTHPLPPPVVSLLLSSSLLCPHVPMCAPPLLHPSPCELLCVLCVRQTLVHCSSSLRMPPPRSLLQSFSCISFRTCVCVRDALKAQHVWEEGAV
jgi:hypothetical protein